MLPIVIFISSLFSILYYLGVMQAFVRSMAVVMQRFMGASGAESTNVAASIVMGQTEAPLTIRPFLDGLTESELFTVMVSGMAHVSGAVMAAYVMIAGVSIAHLLTAVIMTAPATIMLSKMFMPEVGEPQTRGTVRVEIEKPGVNVIDAAARGAGDGLNLALNIAGMLIAFLALIALCNGALGWVHGHIYWFPASMQQILGWFFAPVAWLLGVRWNDCASVGNLLGTRMILNEFVAFVDLGRSPDSSGSALVRNRDLRSVRLCEPEFDSDPDRWYRRSRTLAKVRSRPTRRQSDAGRNARKFHDGLHCRCTVLITQDMTEAAGPAPFPVPLRPTIGIVLGSGLGALADSFTNATRIPYADIPGLPISTAIGHKGELVLGTIGDTPIAAMSGRFHLYEGYSAQQVASGIRMFRELGIRRVVLTNAAGGINLEYATGALVLISDHINLQCANPLIGA